MVSWGIDGRLCLWDSRCYGNISSPIASLVSKDDYPLYALDMINNSKENGGAVIAIGGGRDGGFLGVPIYLYDVTNR